jgi:hypothetical protein
VNDEVNDPQAHSLGTIGSEHERPKSPWTPSYSTTSQGPAVLENLRTEDEVDHSIPWQLPSSLPTSDRTNGLDPTDHSAGTQTFTAEPLRETNDLQEIVTATALLTEVAGIREDSGAPGDITSIHPPTEIPSTNVSLDCGIALTWD